MKNDNKKTYNVVIGFSTAKEAIAAKRLYEVAPEMYSMLIKIYNIENHAFTLKGFDVKRLKSEISELIKKAELE